MKSKIKYTFLSMLLAVFVAQPALASPLNNDDMAFAFADSPAVSSDLGEMALLSDQEMRETKGEWIVYASRFGWGALTGGVSYSVSNYGTSNWSWWGLGRSTLYGGVGGLFGWSNASAATLGAGTSAALGRWGW